MSGDTARPKMFGTAGIRGRTNIDITPHLALTMARCWGDHLGNEGEAGLGRDTRPGSDMLARAAAAGLQAAGIRVHDCGVIPTGGLATYVRAKKLDGAVLITGSHTPPDRNGFILMNEQGAYLPDDEAVLLERMYAAAGQRAETRGADGVADCAPAADPLGTYLAALAAAADPNAVAARNFRVLYDPCNGAACEAFPMLFRAFGVEAVPSNAVAKPRPDRATEPRAANLAAIAARVPAERCHFGVATDIDADRVLFIDDRGRVLSEDLAGALFAVSCLRRGSVCVTPINSSNLIEETCERLGARLEFCRAGQPATVARILEAKADYAYEESGKYYFVKDAAWCDGLLATVKMLGLLASTEKPLSALAAEVPVYHQVKEMISCPDTLKDGVMDRVRAVWDREGLEGKRSDLTIDGLKRSYADRSWLLLRRSGTEPVIRVYSDAKSPERARDLVEWGKGVVRKAIGGA
jgi:phosphomannomutase/phosphoglucomutase